MLVYQTFLGTIYHLMRNKTGAVDLRVQGDWKNLGNIHTSRFVEPAYQQE
jgi:hypothetical protein